MKKGDGRTGKKGEGMKKEGVGGTGEGRVSTGFVVILW